MERIEILRQLRTGEIDILVGINLLRGTGLAGSELHRHSGCGSARLSALTRRPYSDHRSRRT